ncbi:hypothetical protein AHAS_Ahas16G0282500 [Arachis hypogaea]
MATQAISKLAFGVRSISRTTSVGWHMYEQGIPSLVSKSHKYMLHQCLIYVLHEDLESFKMVIYKKEKIYLLFTVS